MDKVVLITGAGRGIGAEIAQKFWEAGFKVVLNYNTSRQKTEAIAKKMNLARANSAITLQADVSCFNAAQALVNMAVKEFGHIDVLVYNAGLAQKKLFIDLTQQDIDRIIDVNLKGAMYVARAALEHMASARKGSVVFISSVFGIVGGSCEAHYSAAKGGLIALTRALAKEYGAFGIRVNAVSPGAIETDMLSSLTDSEKKKIAADTLVGRLGTPKDIADAALWVAEASYVTAQNIVVDGGWTCGAT